MWAHVPPVLLRRATPPLTLGLAVSASLVLAESLLGYLLSGVAPEGTLGVVYLLGVVVVAMAWGFWMAAATAVVSTLAGDFFLVKPIGSLTMTDPRDWAALAIFLVVALSAATLAGLARSRAAEAELRRWGTELSVLAEQQAALRRVAILIARGVSPPEVFAAVADELARCLHMASAGLLRFEADGTGYVVAVQYEPTITTMPLAGEHIQLAGDNVGGLVLRTGRAARIDILDDAAGPESARIRSAGIGSIVGVPVIIDGRLWGAAIVGSTSAEPMAADTEVRIADFADLVATAIANAATRVELQSSRDELGVLADQQAALRRIATLVARGVPPAEVFSAVAQELAGVLDVQNASVWRYEVNNAATLLSAWDLPDASKMPVGQQFSLEGDNIAAMVLHTGCPARMNSHDDAGGRPRRRFVSWVCAAVSERPSSSTASCGA
jgi:GAF domain-containing protein